MQHAYKFDQSGIYFPSVNMVNSALGLMLTFFLNHWHCLDQIGISQLFISQLSVWYQYYQVSTVTK